MAASYTVFSSGRKNDNHPLMPIETSPFWGSRELIIIPSVIFCRAGEYLHARLNREHCTSGHKQKVWQQMQVASKPPSLPFKALKITWINRKSLTMNFSDNIRNTREARILFFMLCGYAILFCVPPAEGKCRKQEFFTEPQLSIFQGT